MKLNSIFRGGNNMGMVEIIGHPAMLEQMAEEASELAKAALKLARIERGENPTPITKEEAEKNLTEEYTDVIQCAIELKLQYDMMQMKRKYERFLNRAKIKNEV